MKRTKIDMCKSAFNIDPESVPKDDPLISLTYRRFDSVRQFASYCHLVPGISQSSDKVKRGKGSNQGNHYLKWAFTQAANIAVRYYPTLRKFRDKHARRRKGNAADTTIFLTTCRAKKAG